MSRSGAIRQNVFAFTVIRFPWPNVGIEENNQYIWGYIEIYHQDKWGSICSNSYGGIFTDRDANVTCKSAGFNHGIYSNGQYNQKKYSFAYCIHWPYHLVVLKERMLTFDTHSSTPPSPKRNIVDSMKTPNVLLWFYKFTSIGGLVQIRSADNRHAKYIWIALFVIGFVMTIWGVHFSIQNYIEYRSVTTVSKNYKTLLTFPSVTICNLNVVHCGNLHAMIENCEQVSKNVFL